jgi:glycosyltransferase involved in cell wall biosynthesis
MKTAVLLVLPWSPDLPGGVSVVVRNLASVWRSQLIPTTILVSDWNTKNARTTDQGVVSLRLGLTRPLTRYGLIKAACFGPVTLMRTLAILRSRRISVAIFHYASLDSLGVTILKRLRLFKGRIVLSFHGTDVRPPHHRLETALWNFVFRSADAVTSCSDSLARQVESTFRLPLGRVTTIYNGVDSSIFTSAAVAFNVLPTCFATACNSYVVSVGSFIKRKGHSFLIDAFSQIANAHPLVGLVIIGMDGDQRTLCEQQFHALGLEDRVCFLVGLAPPEVASVVARAMLCVQPSLEEPFGMAVIEAGACGVCVLASSVGGHAELIHHDKTGLLFPPGDAKGLASTLGTILSDSSKRQVMASCFRREVLANFSWTACANRYLRTAGSS